MNTEYVWLTLPLFGTAFALAVAIYGLYRAVRCVSDWLAGQLARAAVNRAKIRHQHATHRATGHVRVIKDGAA